MDVGPREKDAQTRGDEGRERSNQAEGEVYLYRSAGIRERHGLIPLWLKLVTLGLLVWGIYYTVRYWGGS